MKSTLVRDFYIIALVMLSSIENNGKLLTGPTNCFMKKDDSGAKNDDE